MARKERRNSHRYTPTRAEACLGWWEGRQFHSVPARLRNLSTSGALIEVENGRPPAKRVWICLAGRSPAEWAPASVQDEKEDASEAGILRLNFFEPFPYEPFKAAVWGEQEGHRAAPPRSELPPSESTTRSYQGSGSRPAAVSEVERIRFFLGMGDGPGGGKPDAGDDRSSSPPFAHPPTLMQAHHGQRILHDKIAPVSWLTISAISLIIVLAIVAAATARFEALRWLGYIPVPRP